jgi:putative membrane protein
MKNACLTLAAVVACVLLIAGPASAQSDQQRSGQYGQSANSFMNRAMQVNQAEIEMAKMAQSKTQNPQVKEYAEMMIQDHTQALDKMRSASGGSQGQIQLTKEQQQEMDKLSKLDGAQFDKAYMADMIKDHRQAVQMFQREAGTAGGTTQRQKPGEASGNSSDATMAKDMLPTLQKHLSEAEQISRTMGSQGATK